MTSESLQQEHQPQTIRVLTFNILSTDQASWERHAGHTFSPSNLLVRAGEMPLELGRRIDYVMIRSGIHGPTLAIADCQRVLDQKSCRSLGKRSFRGNG